jgi:hypothetical protein
MRYDISNKLLIETIFVFFCLQDDENVENYFRSARISKKK